jgi:Na+-translocating ferredoxin:NAD+ oxidoreductase RnfG subunit
MKKLDINKVSTTTFILFFICALVTAALAGTNYITKDKIDHLAEENEKTPEIRFYRQKNIFQKPLISTVKNSIITLQKIKATL